MNAARVTLIVIVGSSVLLGLSFVLALGRPWLSQSPQMAWLQAMLAGVALAFDVVFLLALLAVPVPVWTAALILAAQDGVFAWRLISLYAARSPRCRERS